MSSTLPSKPAPYSRDLIEKEIAHLKKRRGTRQAADRQQAWSKFLLTAAIFGLIWLWGMDAVLFSYDRGDAINVYLYLHNYGSDVQASALADSGLLTPDEVKTLNARQGSFQDYFTNTAAAQAKASELIAYMQEVNALHHDHYDQLSPLYKLRYFLFMKTGLIPPIRWNVLNSAIDK